MLNFFALRVRALVPFLLFVVVAVIAADARALVQATDVAVETVALADDARGDTIAPRPRLQRISSQGAHRPSAQ